jgi:peptidyl-prolyl cis-trans isomerase C
MESQAMLKTRVSFVIGALLASGLCLAGDAKPAAPPTNPNIAVVNGVAYPLDLFRAFFLERLQDS